MEKEENVKHFLDLIKRSRRGKFKIYIGMIAGVGKSYRMLQEAHEMQENGVKVKLVESWQLFLAKKYFIKEKRLKKWIWTLSSGYIPNWSL